MKQFNEEKFWAVMGGLKHGVAYWVEDIERALKYAQQPEPKIGQIWKDPDGALCLLTEVGEGITEFDFINFRYAAVLLTPEKQVTMFDSSDDSLDVVIAGCTFVADSFNDYIEMVKRGEV